MSASRRVSESNWSIGPRRATEAEVPCQQGVVQRILSFLLKFAVPIRAVRQRVAVDLPDPVSPVPTQRVFPVRESDRVPELRNPGRRAAREKGRRRRKSSPHLVRRGIGRQRPNVEGYLETTACRKRAVERPTIPQPTTAACRSVTGYSRPHPRVPHAKAPPDGQPSGPPTSPGMRSNYEDGRYVPITQVGTRSFRTRKGGASRYQSRARSYGTLTSGSSPDRPAWPARARRAGGNSFT